MLLAEMVVAVCIITVLLLTLVIFMVFSTRSFTTMFNYVELDDRNRIAMDQLTRDIRGCNKVIACSPTELVLQDSDGLTLSYSFEAVPNVASDYVGGKLWRKKGDAPAKVVLTGCDRVRFEICQRNTMSGSYDVYPAATPATAKVINVAWLCSRKIFGRKENTESVQTARIVIRKQGT
jgi:Tfp pilus assembly protein PilW